MPKLLNPHTISDAYNHFNIDKQVIFAVVSCLIAKNGIESQLLAFMKARTKIKHHDYLINLVNKKVFLLQRTDIQQSNKKTNIRYSYKRKKLRRAERIKKLSDSSSVSFLDIMPTAFIGSAFVDPAIINGQKLPLPWMQKDIRDLNVNDFQLILDNPRYGWKAVMEILVLRAILEKVGILAPRTAPYVAANESSPQAHRPLQILQAPPAAASTAHL